MAWNDRLKTAAYTSPSGRRVEFIYDDVAYSFNRKTTGFEFVDAGGTYVQDNKTSSRRIPLEMILSGSDYDLTANNLMEMLAEQGEGTLEHPVYGEIKVVPFGDVSRSDAVKSGGNQAVISLIFWETIGIIYPTRQNEPRGEVQAAIEAFNASAAEQVSESAGLDSASQRATFKGTFTRSLDTAKDNLQSVADASEAIEKQFNTVFNSINTGIDVLIKDPLTLANQALILAQLPARSTALIKDRLDAYANLARNLIGGSDNEFYSTDLYATAYVSASVVATLENQFSTRSEALDAAASILTLLDEVNTWRENNHPGVDTGEVYQALQQAVALNAGFLVSISFTLKQERRRVLDRDTSFVTLVAELYNSVSDEDYNFFINSNDLTGSELIELKKGREIVYYV